MNARPIWKGLYNKRMMGIGREVNGLQLLKDQNKATVGTIIKNGINTKL